MAAQKPISFLLHLCYDIAIYWFCGSFKVIIKQHPARGGDAFFTHFDAPVINLLTVASTFWGSQRKVPPPTPSPSADVNAVNAYVA